MKRQLVLWKAATAVGVLAATFVFPVFAAQVNEEKAKSIALENSGVKEEQVAFLNAVQDEDDGRMIFEVELVTKANEEYDYDILMENGEILGISYEKKLRSAEGRNSSAEITLEQAQKTALEHSGADAVKITWIKQKEDIDDGRLTYELEFYTDSFQKFDYDIDGKNGEIVAWEWNADSSYARRDAARRLEEAKNTADQKNSTGQAEGVKSISRVEDAKKAALKQAGLRDDQVTWGRVYKSFDDGKAIYEGKFFYNSFEYEFEIDAATGAVIDWDVESIWD